jgi:hypothetical protein
MAVERERGISVSSAVMSFEHQGLAFNLLDTPGHQDFSEDTYRTLTAVDSAVMVLDAAKGIEEQTRKLFEVCRLRDVPIITFVNKLDRLQWPPASARSTRTCQSGISDDRRASDRYVRQFLADAAFAGLERRAVQFLSAQTLYRRSQRWRPGCQRPYLSETCRIAAGARVHVQHPTGRILRQLPPKASAPLSPCCGGLGSGFRSISSNWRTRLVRRDTLRMPRPDFFEKSAMGVVETVGDRGQHRDLAADRPQLTQQTILLARKIFQANSLRHGSLFDRGQRLVRADLLGLIDLCIIGTIGEQSSSLSSSNEAESATFPACSSLIAATTTSRGGDGIFRRRAARCPQARPRYDCGCPSAPPALGKSSLIGHKMHLGHLSPAAAHAARSRSNSQRLTPSAARSRSASPSARATGLDDDRT